MEDQLVTYETLAKNSIKFKEFKTLSRMKYILSLLPLLPRNDYSLLHFYFFIFFADSNFFINFILGSMNNRKNSKRS